MNEPLFETISLQDDGQVATLRLVAPQIDTRQLRELEAALDWLEDDSPATTLVIRGGSEGIDFQDFQPEGPPDIHGFNKWEKMLQRLEKLHKLTVFVAEDPCVGGGFQMLLACDIRVATARASFSLPEVRLGFLPGMATWRLARYVGLGRAKRLVLSGASIDAFEALDMGLLDVVQEDAEEAVASALALVDPVHPVTVALARRLLLESASTPFEDALGNFLAAQSRAINQAAFLQTLKRERKTT